MIGFIVLIVVSWMLGWLWGFVTGHAYVLNKMQRVVADRQKTRIEDLRPR